MRELEDITTLSDTHKRYIVVNDGKGISSELTERLIADIKRGMQSNEIPEPMFTPVFDDENHCPVINMEHDYRVVRNGGMVVKVECKYCSHCLNLGDNEFIEMPGSPWLIKRNEPGRVAVVDIESDDNKIIGTRDLVICFILLVVAAITIAAHWIFGG